MSTVLYWFRSDLRLHDQPALRAALTSGATHLLPVVCLPAPDERTPWGFARVGPHRRAFIAAALRGLQGQMSALGNPLLICRAPPATALPQLAQAVGATTVVCEDIAAPYEQAEVAALRAAGLQVRTVWQSSLLSPTRMPWPVDQLPGVFTSFRQKVERAGITPAAPMPAPTQLLPPPDVPAPVLQAVGAEQGAASIQLPAPPQGSDARSSFPYGTPGCDGSEAAALAHLAQYLARKLPHSYKATRNGLTGLDYSSKFSPWLATGALSPRQIDADLKAFERDHGANDGTYWLWFELLWRDYFRLLHLQYGAALYRARGLSELPPAPHNPRGFDRWCRGDTGQPLVGEPIAPPPDGVGIGAQQRGDVFALHALGRRQDDLGAQDKPSRALASTAPARKDLLLLLLQHNRLGPSHRHHPPIGRMIPQGRLRINRTYGTLH